MNFHSFFGKFGITNYGNFDHQPQEKAGHFGVVLVGHLGHISAGYNAKTGREALEEEAEKVGHQQHPEKLKLIGLKAGS